MFKKNKITLLWVALGLLFVALLVVRIEFADQNWPWIAILVAMVANVVVLLRENASSLRRRTTAFGIQSIVTMLLVLGILGVLNYFGSEITHKFDLTKDKVHTLSDQTHKVLKGLNREIKGVFFAKLPEQEEKRPLFENYKAISSKFNVEFVDPNKEITRAKQAGIKVLNTLVLTAGERTQRVEDPNEEKLTNALIKITKESNQTLCWLEGHGEKAISSKEGPGYDTVQQGLKDQAYEIQTVNLFQEGKIPPQCSAVAIVGPEKSFFEKEIEVVKQYLANGGRVLFALDIDVKKGKDKSPELLPVLREWFVSFDEALIVDPLSRLLGGDAAMPILATFAQDHAITKDFQTNCFFPFARPLEITKDIPSDIKVNWLAKTTPKSWGEADFNELTQGKVKFTSGKDFAGPLTTAVAVEGKQKDSKAPNKTRMVVFSTSQFAANEYSRFGGNIDLFLNAMSWVLEDESLISIRKKEEEEGRIELSQKEGTYIQLGTVAVLPSIIALFGVVNWVRRRRL